MLNQQKINKTDLFIYKKYKKKDKISYIKNTKIKLNQFNMVSFYTGS